MKNTKKVKTFKYKLSVLLFTVVIIVSSFLGVFQYMFINNVQKDNFLQRHNMIRDRLINAVKDADYISYLLENSLELDAIRILDEIAAKYKEDGTIDFDLEPFLEGTQGTNIYIIDRDNKVIKTTDKLDMNLDFSKAAKFVEYLDSVRESKIFDTTRINLSTVEGEMKKYCYLASYDGTYVFETGAVIKQDENLKGRIGFDNFQDQIMKDNNHLENILMYEHTGVSYKKDENGKSIVIADSQKKYFDKAVKNMEVVTTVKTVDGKKLYYEYIPYEIIGAKGINKRNVIEVIYNEIALNTLLQNYINTNIIVILVVAFIAASFGVYKARIISKPVKQITDGVKQVAKGNFNIQLGIDSKDEFSLLAAQFEKMTREIKELLMERSSTQQDLEYKNKEISEQKDEIEALYEETISINEELENLLKKNKVRYFDTVRALANAIEEKDIYTGGHCERVMGYSMMIAEAMGLSEEEKNDLKFGSILHDIGKIGIPEYILNKCDKLTEEEYIIVKKHSETGYRMLKDLDFLERSRDIVYDHHERMDGKGYPRGLKGEEINLLARIVCVADAFDAMTSNRTYKDVMNKEEAITELLDKKGSQFDSEVVEAFIKSIT